MKITILFCLLFGGGLTVYCQSLSPHLISSSGGYNLIGDVKMHWAVGELAINEHRNGIILTEGFFQAYANALTDIPESFIDAEIRIYPNPASDFISISHASENRYTCYVIDHSGKLLSECTIDQPLTRMDVHAYPSGTYYCILQDGQGLTATYSFIKI